jgi:tetratricopeptide (TPR) repeat protein
MKFKHLLFSLMCGSSMMVFAQGYQDGIEYFKADQFDNAREILTRTLSASDTDSASALYYLGAIALRDGDTATAEKYFNQGIAADEKNGLNYVGLGAIALKNGDAKGAADQFKAATKAENTASVMVAAARAYYDADPVAYAKDYEKYMDSAFRKDKKNVDIYIMRGDKLRDEAQAEADETKIGEAAAAYDMAIYYNQTAPEAYVKYASVYRHANPQFAIDKLTELNSLAPNSALAQRELAECYYDNDQWTRAAQQYGVYIKNPNHFKQDEERYAVLLYFGKNYDQSLSIANERLASDPNSFVMRRMVFLNLAAQEKYADARSAAETFFACTPPSGNHFTANDYTTYATVLHELEDYDAEVTALEQAIAANPDKGELLKDLSAAYSQSGARALKNEDSAAANAAYIKAAETFQKFIDNNEYKTQDLVDLASRYQNVAATSADAEAKETAINHAISTIDQVIERVPDNFIPVRNKARMLFVKNNSTPSAESTETYKKVISLLDADPENVTKRADAYTEAYQMIGRYYVSTKDNANAREALAKYLEFAPNDEGVRQLYEKLK